MFPVETICTTAAAAATMFDTFSDKPIWGEDEGFCGATMLDTCSDKFFSIEDDDIRDAMCRTLTARSNL